MRNVPEFGTHHHAATKALRNQPRASRIVCEDRLNGLRGENLVKFVEPILAIEADAVDEKGRRRFDFEPGSGGGVHRP